MEACIPNKNQGTDLKGINIYRMGLIDGYDKKKAEPRRHYRILKKGGETNFDKAFDTPCCSISQIDEILKHDNKWVNS